ncbi:MAG: ribosome biogenesis GTP-binding protein YihA/YsxC, partial [Clostridia bacterium]
MIIKKCEFIKSAADYSGFIVSADIPQIVVAGKSNVGKSSFINFLTNNSKMAKTSNTPGRTRLVNYFAINDFLLVDLPGYGYAKGVKTEVEAWGYLMDDFFTKCRSLIRHVIVLVDVRHLPSQEDLEFVQFLNAYRFSFSVIATKSDKLSKMVVKQNLAKIATALKIGIGDIFAISSTSKVGKEQVLALLEH